MLKLRRVRCVGLKRYREMLHLHAESFALVGRSTWSDVQEAIARRIKARAMGNSCASAAT